MSEAFHTNQDGHPRNPSITFFFCFYISYLLFKLIFFLSRNYDQLRILKKKMVAALIMNAIQDSEYKQIINEYEEARECVQ